MFVRNGTILLMETNGSTRTLIQLRFDKAFDPLQPPLSERIFYRTYGNDFGYARPDGTVIEQILMRAYLTFFTVSPDGSWAVLNLCGIRIGDGSGLWVLKGYNLTFLYGLRYGPYPNGSYCYMAPAWSPDGKKIAHWMGNELWVFNASKIPALTLEAQNLSELSKMEFLEARPIGFASFNYIYSIGGTGRGGDEISWSPDSSWIAFSSRRYGNKDIFIVREDGSRLVRLTNDSSSDYSPSWSPDGTKIAFVRDDQIFVMELDLEAPSTLEPIPTTIPTLTPPRETPVPGFNSILALSTIIIVAFLLACLGKKNKGSGDRNG
jgi:Tol biopolymer transport system component